jgi:tetratricopeptide (TPR) repeat protein
LAIALFLFFSSPGRGEANSFPFRNVNLGDRLPPLAVVSLASRQEVSLDQFTGQPLLLVFFGADLPAKKKRAVKTLQALQESAAYLAAKGVVTLAVDAQGDTAALVAEVAASAGFVGELYADGDHRAYGALGIFVLPSALLVAADGTIAAGLGYSHDFGRRLQGEIAVMLGEKSVAQAAAELRPLMVEKSAAEKGGRRHLNLGLTMLERGQPESAMRELVKAVALDPGLGQAYAHLGCLQLDGGRPAEAEVSLARGLELEPDLIDGLICQARLKATAGDLDGAIEDLGFLMLRNNRNDDLHYTLGLLLEQKGDAAGAMPEYRKAYELLRDKSGNE